MYMYMYINSSSFLEITFCIFIQGILYKEYQDAKIGWEEEKQKMTEGMEEMKILKEQDKVKTEELQVHVHIVYNFC